LFLACLVFPVVAAATVVRIETPLGAITVQLFDDVAPGTVANFLRYVNDGDYANSFIHRSMPGFVVQGGGFTFENDIVGNVPTDPPIANEFDLSNLRGTIAMAKTGNDPDSATSQWFINLGDNSANLDNQNGGFTVFGQVVGNGMDVADAIAALAIVNAGGAFTDLPVIDFSGGTLHRENLVMTDVVLWRFADVPADHWAFSFIETLADSGITSGCDLDNYCPLSPVTRAQMAVFLERGINGSDYSPPAASGNVFLDVDGGDFAASFIEQFFLDGITSGCGNNNYCPDIEVTRAQMAVFLLRAKHGADYSPPPASGLFDDVPLSHWAVHWIEQLATEGITSGCDNDNFCPGAVVTRDQMAVFLVRAFEL